MESRSRTVTVSVSEANDRLSGVIVTFAAVCVTVTEAVALCAEVGRPVSTCKGAAALLDLPA
mgnify:CR=1 FL=1